MILEMNNKKGGYALIGILIGVLIMGLLFVAFLKGDGGDENGLNSNGVPAESQNQIEEYRGNIQQAEDIKNILESKSSIKVD